MRRIILVALFVVPFPAFAQDVQPIDAEQLQRIATRLGEEVADIDNPQIEIEPDVAHAVGLKIREDGVVCLPHNGLSEETIEETCPLPSRVRLWPTCSCRRTLCHCLTASRSRSRSCGSSR